MSFPQPLLPGKRLQDGLTLDELLANPVWSATRPLTALAGGTRTTSPKIVETVVNVASAAAGAGITLPVAIPGKMLMICNNTVNSVRVFADDPSSIDGVSGNTGVLIAAQSLTLFVAQELRKWTYTTLALYTAPVRDYLSAYDTTTQTNGDATARQIMTFDTTDASNGIAIAGGSKITVSNTGLYNIQFSAQLDKTDSGRDAIEIWLVKNGNNLPWTNTWVEADGNNAKVVAAWNWVIPLNAGDFVEIAWWSADSTMRLFARPEAAAVPGVSPARPAIPSVILSVVGV